MKLDYTPWKDFLTSDRFDMIRVNVCSPDSARGKLTDATRFAVDGERLTMVREIDSDEEAHAEEVNETRLAMDHGLYDCGQDD